MAPRTLRDWVAKHQADRQTREWLIIGPLKIYIRLTNRHVDGKIVRSLNLVNIEVATKRRGQGIFTAFAQDVEALADEMGLHVYVESILKPRFAKWWLRRGYKEIGTQPGDEIINVVRVPQPVSGRSSNDGMV